MKKIFSFSLILFLLLTACQQPAGRDAFSFDEPADPDTLTAASWQGVTGRVQAAFGSSSIRYARGVPPREGLSAEWKAVAWRGERIHGQVVVWSTEDVARLQVSVTPLRDGDRQIDAAAVTLHPLGYVLADTGFTGCRRRSQDTMRAQLSPGILYENKPFSLPARSVRPVWINIQVPPATAAGTYHGAVVVATAGDSLYLPVSIRVQEMVLPPPREWQYHLDLWQNPYAIARYHKVAVWSQDHWYLVRKYLDLLSEAGQKCITTTIVDKPWHGQTYDPFGSMVGWLHNSDGTWEYDYSVFDQYVQTAMEQGITEQINCYTMVTWGNLFRYYDEDSAAYVTLKARPGSPEYESLWRPFLLDFRSHLQEMGWLEKTAISLDERGLEDTKNLIRFLQATVPEMKLTLAGGFFEEIMPDIYDFSYNFWHLKKAKTPSVADGRREKGRVTTWYVACNVPWPNNFTFSPPDESALQGWITAALHLDGFLRWAYNSWPGDVMHDSRFRTWPSGDTYFVYPGPYSSVRFEKLIEGIQDHEKIRILTEMIREKGITLPDSLDLQQYLDKIDPAHPFDAAQYVRKGREMLEEITEMMAGGH